MRRAGSNIVPPESRCAVEEQWNAVLSAGVLKDVVRRLALNCGIMATEHESTPVVKCLFRGFSIGQERAGIEAI